MVTELDSLSWHSYDEDVSYSSKIERSKSTDSSNKGAIVLQQAGQSEICPTFGNISVCNGSDIHFGNKTIYQGPVTIKQFVVTDGDKLKKIRESEVPASAVEKLNLGDCPNEGVNNPCFNEDIVNENSDNNAKNTLESNNNNHLQPGYAEVLGLKKFLTDYKIPVVSIGLFLVIFSLSVLILSKLWKNTDALAKEHDYPKIVDDEHSHNTPIDGPIDPRKIKPLGLKIVSRYEWLAQPPRHTLDPLKTPVPYVIISHTATETCLSQAQCVFHVRYIQTFHIESRGWWDIGYNFLLGGDGEVYIGRGWDKEGSHTFGYNKLSIGIAFIGTFIDILPTENQILACKRLIAKGVELGYLKKGYKLLGARQLQTSQSPGDTLFEEIKKWPHWSDKP